MVNRFMRRNGDAIEAGIVIVGLVLGLATLIIHSTSFILEIL